MSDPVIRRADGSWLYMLPSVIDDVEMGVTHVVRGEDHVSNTALQIQMFAALGRRRPVRARGAAGRQRGQAVEAARLARRRRISARPGIEPEAIVALLARIGTSDPVEPFVDPRR